MSDLTDMKCEACRSGASGVSEEELRIFLPQIPEWKRYERDGIPCLERSFVFANFAEALAFTNRVGALAEEAGHHPAILTEWGRVTVTWWTHKIRNLHRNDFIMARRTDELKPD